MADIKAIRQKFFVLRNGVLSDRLREAGYPYKLIFGLMIPDIASIAREIGGEDLSLARQLWVDDGVRESRLLACYLFPREGMTYNDAMALARSVKTEEEADMLCFRLLKHLPFAAQIVDETRESEDPLARYLSRMLANHLS